MRMLRPLREWEGNVRERLTFERDAGNQSVKVRCVLHPFRARFKKKRRIGRVGARRVRHALKFKTLSLPAQLRDRQTAMIPLPSVKKVYGEGVSVRVLTRIAFVTVKIVDADGNRVYAEEDERNPFEGIWRF